MKRRSLVSTDSIVEMLEDRIEDLVLALYPGALVVDHIAYPAARSKDDLGSFQVYLTSGKKRQVGHWRRYSQGIGGNALNLIVYWQTGERSHKGKAEYAAAILWAKQWLGLEENLSPAELKQQEEKRARERAERQRRIEAEERAEAHRTRMHVRQILAGAEELRFEPADPVVLYLRSRGLDLASWHAQGRKLPPLQLHPNLKHFGGLNWTGPAMVARLVSPEGWRDAVHVTFVKPDGSGKAPLGRGAKLMRGDIAGAIVPISRGRGDRPLHEVMFADETVDLIVAEGIETALALALALPDLAVWAALSLGNIKSVPANHPAIGRIIVAAENDTKPQAVEALEQALEILSQLRKPVTTMRSHVGSDFADLMKD